MSVRDFDVVVPTFDYEILSADDRTLVREQSTCIRRASMRLQSLVRQTAETAWDLGRMLTIVRDLVGETRFPDWLQHEFPDWSRSSAYNFIRVYTTYSQQQVQEIQIGLKTMYLLAQDNTPETVRQEIIERDREGERVTYDQARVLIDTHRQSAPAALRQQVEEAGWEITAGDDGEGFLGRLQARSITTSRYPDDYEVVQAIIEAESREIQALTESRGGTYQAIQANGPNGPITIGQNITLPGQPSRTYRIAEARTLLEQLPIQPERDAGAATQQSSQDATSQSSALLALGRRLGTEWHVKMSIEEGTYQAIHMSSGYVTPAGSADGVARAAQAAQPLIADLAQAGWGIYTDSSTGDLVGTHEVHGTRRSTTLDSLHQVCVQTNARVPDALDMSETCDLNALVAQIGATIDVAPGQYTVVVGDVRHTCESREQVVALVRQYQDALSVRLPRDPVAAARILAQHYDPVVLAQALHRSRGG